MAELGEVLRPDLMCMIETMKVSSWEENGTEMIGISVALGEKRFSQSMPVVDESRFRQELKYWPIDNPIYKFACERLTAKLLWDDISREIGDAISGNE